MPVEIVEATIHQIIKAEKTKNKGSVTVKPRTSVLPTDDVLKQLCSDLVDMFGAVANSNAHVALSTTGIAGPGGAVPGKPVGTVCFAWSRDGHTHTERLIFQGDRQAVRRQTVIHSLQGLLKFLA